MELEADVKLQFEPRLDSGKPECRKAALLQIAGWHLLWKNRFLSLASKASKNKKEKKNQNQAALKTLSGESPKGNGRPRGGWLGDYSHEEPEIKLMRDSVTRKRRKIEMKRPMEVNGSISSEETSPLTPRDFQLCRTKGFVCFSLFFWTNSSPVECFNSWSFQFLMIFPFSWVAPNISLSTHHSLKSLN